MIDTPANLRAEIESLRAQLAEAQADFRRVDDETLAFLRGDIRYREMAETLRLRLGLPVPGKEYMCGPVQPSPAERIEELERLLAEARGDRCNVCDDDGLIYVSGNGEAPPGSHDEIPEACPECGGTKSGYASRVTKERDEARQDVALARWREARARPVLTPAERSGLIAARYLAVTATVSETRTRALAVIDRLLAEPAAPEVTIATLDRGNGPEPVSQSFVSPAYAAAVAATFAPYRTACGHGTPSGTCSATTPHYCDVCKLWYGDGTHYVQVVPAPPSHQTCEGAATRDLGWLIADLEALRDALLGHRSHHLTSLFVANEATRIGDALDRLRAEHRTLPAPRVTAGQVEAPSPDALEHEVGPYVMREGANTVTIPSALARELRMFTRLEQLGYIPVDADDHPPAAPGPEAVERVARALFDAERDTWIRFVDGQGDPDATAGREDFDEAWQLAGEREEQDGWLAVAEVAIAAGLDPSRLETP